MKRVLGIFIISILFLNIQITSVHSETIRLIEEKLSSLGIAEEYRDNIITYINDLDISSEQMSEILEDSKSVISNVKEKSGYEDFTFSELFNIYGEILNIANDLNIDINIDFSKKEVELIDKGNSLTLFKCDIDTAKKYYENYKEDPMTSEEYNEVMSYISEGIDNNIKNSEWESKNKSDSYSDNEQGLSKEENVDRNIEVSENTSNDSDNILNKASTIKNKNVNKTLSIIYIILFVCVIFSVLIGKMFNEK